MLLTLVTRSLRNNARISAWTLVTLATSAALVTVFSTTTLEVGRKMRRELRRLGANAVAQPAGPAADWSRFEAVARAHGATTARLISRVGMIEGQPIAVVAADSGRLEQLTPYWAVTGTRPRAAGECLVGRRAAITFGLQVGGKVVVDDTKLRVTGIVSTGDEDEDRVFVSRAGVSPVAVGGERITGETPALPAEFTYAILSVAEGEVGIERLQQELATAGAGVMLKPLRQVLHGEETVLAKVNLLFGATLVAVLALTTLGVSASVLARVVERRKEFALLRAIGAKRRAVVAFLLAESATVGVLGAVAGFTVGSGLAAVVAQQIFHVPVGLRALAFVAALVTTTLVALVAGGIACGRTLRFQPAAALRGE